MLSNSVLGLVRNTIYSNLALFFTAFLLQLLLSDGSPVSDATRSLNGGCPTHWRHIGRFCYKEGKGSTHRDVAFYCDRYGGIGINGLCLIRAPNRDRDTQSAKHSGLSLDLSSQRSSDSLSGSALGTLGQIFGRHGGVVSEENGEPLDEQSAGDVGGVLSEEKRIDELGCPKGWMHFQNICVYKTLSVEEQCRHLKAEEFYGFCLKYAEPKEQAIQERDNFSRTDKRVCCCPHFHAKANGYAC